MTYACRNCRSESLTAVFHWWVEGDNVYFEKVGQHPGMEIQPPKDLRKALSDQNIRFYTKALTLRHNGFGIGALVYIRRVVEDTVDELLNLLENAAKEAGSAPGALAAIAEARKSRPFDQKVKTAAVALPAHLARDGQNPLDLLYVLLSEGIHGLTEEECIEIVDDIDGILAYLFRELKIHLAERRSYDDGFKKLAARRSKPKPV